MKEKSDLRKQSEAHRHSLAKPDFADRLAAFAPLLPLEPQAVVSGYWAFRDEADPRALMLALAERGHPLCLPAIAGKRAPLRFHRWRPTDAMRRHVYGVTEPRTDAERITPSVLLVPLLAFDAAGYRLGYGGGFYDCTLNALRLTGPVLAIGIAYAGQEVAVVPHGPHDERLDAVLTENGYRTFEHA